MKKIFFLMIISILTLCNSAFAENKYGQCQQWCKKDNKFNMIKEVEKACKWGCSYAHWNGKNKGYKLCSEKYGEVGSTAKACKKGVAEY